MTLTTKTMEWLNQNRRRSYPMQRDEWRSKASPESGLDCILLDALLFDADSEGEDAGALRLVSVEVSENSTSVVMSYGGRVFSKTLEGGETSGVGSFEIWAGKTYASDDEPRVASFSFVLSSHEYIKSAVGLGSWSLGCPVLGTRVVRLTDGAGVNITVNGSAGVSGHGSASVVDGHVVLEDGFRTSPVVSRGTVLVRVGKRYGLDPCNYDFGDSESRDCRRPLFYFCGQNAVNSGNIVIKGGKGVNVAQGGEYVVHDKNSKCDGMSIPCVEIVAGRELLDMYKPKV